VYFVKKKRSRKKERGCEKEIRKRLRNNEQF
jgi:hypothetical protein